MHQRLNVVVRMLAACVLAAAANYVAAQQAYPSKPMRIIVPLTPGGATDTIARLLGEKLKETWGQPVVIENRAGGNTVIGSQTVARASPDGYTLLVAADAHVIIPLLATGLPYQAKDFAPVATLTRARYVMVVNPSLPNTLQEFIAYAKARPGQINFGSSGSGAGSHIAGEVFSMLAGVQMQHVPFKGGAESVTNVIGGHVQVSYNTPVLSGPHINAGRLRGLAVTGQTRFGALPQVPTFIEAGLPAYDEKSWQGLFAPAATPKPVVDKLSAEVGRMLAAPDFKTKIENMGFETFISTADQFAAMTKAETAKLVKVIKVANIKIEN